MANAVNADDLGELFYQAIQLYSKNSPRSQQAGRFELGISDLGTCQERTRRTIAEITPDDDRDLLAAFIGTAVGDHAEQAFAQLVPEALIQQVVTLGLTGDGGRYVLTGHPDIVLPEWGIIDVKTTDGLEIAKRNGPSRQQLFQRHGYALGAHLGGLFTIPLDEVMTANVWIDRSGATHEVFIQYDHFSMDVIEEMTMWLDDVVYAHLHGERARKEPPREWCAKACGYFTDCRALDTDVDGLITDPEVVTAAQMYREGLALEKKGGKLKDEAKAALQGVRGNTPEFAVRWTHVNASDVSFTRKSYERLSVTPL